MLEFELPFIGHVAATFEQLVVIALFGIMFVSAGGGREHRHEDGKTIWKTSTLGCLVTGIIAALTAYTLVALIVIAWRMN